MVPGKETLMSQKVLRRPRFVFVFALGTLLMLGGCGSGTDIAAGEAAIENGDKDRALAILLPHAKSGSVKAQYLVGITYQGRWTGSDDTSGEKVEAVRWLGRAADQGHVPAQAQLGILLVVGHGVTDADRKRSTKLLTAAAEAGNAVGQTMLGSQMAMSNRLGQPGHETGLAWLEKAAAQRNAGAFHSLAQIRELDAGYAHHRGNAAQARDFRIEVLKWTLLSVLVTGEFNAGPSTAIVRKYDSPYDAPALTEVARRAEEWIEANGIKDIDGDAAKKKLKELRRQFAK